MPDFTGGLSCIERQFLLQTQIISRRVHIERVRTLQCPMKTSHVMHLSKLFCTFLSGQVKVSIAGNGRSTGQVLWPPTVRRRWWFFMLKNIIMYSPLLGLYPWLGPVWRLCYLRYALSCISANVIQKTLFCECGGRAFFQSVFHNILGTESCDIIPHEHWGFCRPTCLCPISIHVVYHGRIYYTFRMTAALSKDGQANLCCWCQVCKNIFRYEWLHH